MSERVQTPAAQVLTGDSHVQRRLSVRRPEALEPHVTPPFHIHI